MLARCLENLGQNELAVSELSNILADDKHHMAALRQLFELHLKMKNWDAAEKMILARLEEQPDTPRWPGLLLDLYRARGDADKAIQYGKEAAEKSQFIYGAIAPLLDACLEFKRYDDLIEFVNKTLPADQREIPPVLLKTATAYAAQGKRLPALECYNRALDLLTGQIRSFADIAADLVRRMGGEEARKAIQKRLTQNPDERASKFVLGKLQGDAGDMSAFVTTVKGLLETIPADDPEAVGEKLFLMQSLAMSYGQAEDHENARKTYEEILKINPYHVVALNNLAYLLIDHFNDAQSALPYAQQAAQIVPNDPSVLDTLGWTFALLGEHDVAIAVLRRSIGMNDGLAAVHYHAAEVFLQRADKDAAKRDADLREAKTECQRAHELIMAAGRDTEGVFDKVIALGDKLGLTLDKKLPGI
jgi:tetratricopeptide (TPR) repeat protein